jgi:hypothetical protein
MVPAAQSAARILRQALRIRPTDNPEAFEGQLISHISESEGSKRNREALGRCEARIPLQADKLPFFCRPGGGFV